MDEAEMGIERVAMPLGVNRVQPAILDSIRDAPKYLLVLRRAQVEVGYLAKTDLADLRIRGQ